MNIMMMPMATKNALPWMATANPATVPPSRLLGETEFASIYAAADFAAEFQMPMDTLVTISWSLLGVTSDSAVQAAFTSFTKCLRDWLTNRVNPIAFIYAHEVGAVVGLHSHLAVFVAGERNRLEFRHWVRGWADRFAGQYIPRAVRVTGPRIDTPWLHWLRFGYMMKGFDAQCIVQSGRTSPDGQDVRLGHLIPFAWTDPGVVPLTKRVGASRSLGPERRSIGVPGGFDYLLSEPGPSRETLACFGIYGATSRPPRAPKPFRSKYDDGARDVRVLYGADVVERITGMPLAASNEGVDDASNLGWLEGVSI